MYTGLLNVMNEDEVAFCLSHELSHAILRHTEENLSFLGVLMWLKSVGAFLIRSDVCMRMRVFCVGGVYKHVVVEHAL